MTHFELFQLPVGYRFSRAELLPKYMKLQKQYHPDYHGTADSDEQANMMQLSTQVNEAYRVMQREEACIKYVLQLHEMMEEEEKYTLDPMFLMEVMELNEAKMDGADPETIAAKANALQQDILEPVDALLNQRGDAVSDKESLKAIKNYYYQKKYLDRLLAE